MKFVYCGFDFFESCLSACIADGHKLIAAFSHPVDGVYNHASRVRAICESQGIALLERSVTLEDIVGFGQGGCDLLITAAYRYRIPADELANAGIKGINIHPSVLPDGRGPWPLPHYILRCSPVGGVTIHKLAETFDSGEILGQRSFALCPDENLESLSCKVQIEAPTLLREVVRNLDHLWKNGRVQSVGSYWKMPTEPERILDWSKSVEEIDRVARAFGKFDSYANFDGKDWLVQSVTVWKCSHAITPGTIVHRTNLEVVIAASDGLVCLRHFREEPKIL